MIEEYEATKGGKKEYDGELAHLGALALCTGSRRSRYLRQCLGLPPDYVLTRGDLRDQDLLRQIATNQDAWIKRQDALVELGVLMNVKFTNEDGRTGRLAANSITKEKVIEQILRHCINNKN